MKNYEWYEKYIGYSFNDNGQEVILEDIYSYEDGRKCYQLYYPETEKRCITDYKGFMEIRRQTALPR